MAIKNEFTRQLFWLSACLSIILFSLSVTARAEEFTATTVENNVDVTVMAVTGSYDMGRPDELLPRQVIAREFFDTHADNYDFLIVFSDFEYQMPVVTIDGETHVALGFYTPVRNDVEGIGQSLYDTSALYGSDGKLQGYIDMGCIRNTVTDPLDPDFTIVLNILSHELLHRWAARVKFRDKDGQNSDDLLGYRGHGGERAHWSYLFDTSGSVLYGNDWHDNGDGTFTSLAADKYYSPLDLYLMGLIPKSEVPPMLLIENSGASREKLPREGDTITGTARYISVDDIIAAEGNRNPDWETSQKEFKIGVIYITRPGMFQEPALFNVRTVIEHWLLWVSSLTDGKANIRVDASPFTDLPQNPGIEPPPYTPKTTPPAISEAVAWLMGNQNGDGSWRDTLSTDVRDTSTALISLRHFAEASSSLNNGLGWLRAAPHGNVDYLARKIMALSQLGEPDADLVEALVNLQNSDGGWGGGKHYVSNVEDTALALKALVYSGITDTDEIAAAVEYLKTHQHPGQGWGCDDLKSSIRTTVNVLTALTYLMGSQELSAEINGGLLWLLSRQNLNGGFGNGQSTIYDTSAALSVFSVLNVSSDVVTRAMDYIMNLQSENGSWYASAHQTAMAISAVWRTTSEPDLSVVTGDISFTPDTVSIVPSDIQITVKVNNNGMMDAAGVKVALYRDMISPQTKIEEKISDIPGKTSLDISFSVTITDSVENRFYVRVDPEDTINEWRETNNTAIRVLYPSDTYDFVVGPSDLSITPGEPAQLDPVTIHARIHNQGTQAANNVPLKYQIESDNGVFDLTTVYLNIPGGGHADHEYVWQANQVGQEIKLHAVVDPTGYINEVNEDNNIATLSFAVVPRTEPNLAIAPADIILSPDPACKNGNADILARVKNNGGGAAENVRVDIYNGLPSTGGEIIGTQTIPALPPGGEETVTLTWETIPVAGKRLIAVKLDPENSIPEISEDDNDAFSEFDILDIPDLALSTHAILFDPPAPKEGDLVTIHAVVQNAGGQPASNILVTLREDGEVLGSQTLLHLPGNSQETASFQYDTSGKTGARSVTVVVDPEDTIAEQKEDNNTAARSFTIQDSNLWLTERFISPNGDGVKDGTLFTFRFPEPASVKVLVIDSEGGVVREISDANLENTTGGTVAWDGLDNGGRVVEDGRYRIQVVDTTGQVLAGLPVIVDNNRSPLTQAVGTEYLMRNNLTCPLTNIIYEWFPDESGLVFTMTDNGLNMPTGLFTMTPDGDNILRLIPPELEYVKQSNWSTSPDGNKIVFINSPPDGKEKLWKVDRYANNLTLLDEGVDDRDYCSSIAWSPGGDLIAYDFYGYSNGNTDIRLSEPDGGNKRILHTEYAKHVIELKWAPDNHAIASVVSDSENGGHELKVIDLEGNVTTLADVAGSLLDSEWLGNDRIIYMETPRNDGDDNIWLIDVMSGSEPVKLGTDSSGWSRLEFEISPDGKSFIANDYNEIDEDNGVCRLKWRDETGNEQILHETKAFRSLIDHVDSILDLRFSPDGKKIAFIDRWYQQVDECRYHGFLVVVDLATGEKEVFQVSAYEDVCGTPDMAGDEAPANPVSYGWNSLRWMPDSTSLLVDNSEGLFMCSLTTGEKTALPVGNGKRRMGVSPHGRYITVEEPAGNQDTCPQTGYYDLWTISSLLNLTADLQILKKGAALILKGTAADLNFSEYHLEYAHAETPDTWQMIAPPSGVPVVNDILATWALPEEGSFYVRLTVKDRAGNQTSVIRRVSSAFVSSIAKVYLSDKLFSPNGDGVKDRVELRYEVLKPSQLEFVVYDRDDNVIQTFDKYYESPGSDYISWDGRDQGGGTVPDGIYRINILAFDFFVKTDSTPPGADLEFGPVNATEDREVYVGLKGLAEDPNLKEWIVEYGDGADPTEWHELRSGNYELRLSDVDGQSVWWPFQTFEIDNMAFLADKTFRLSARDEAGNISYAETRFEEEAVFIHKWNNTAIQEMRGEWSKVYINRKHAYDPYSGKLEWPEYFGFGIQEMAVVQTIAAPISEIALQYKTYTGRTCSDTVSDWHDAPVTGDISSRSLALEWNNDPANIEDDIYALRLKIVDETSREYFSNEIITGIRENCGQTPNPCTPGDPDWNLTVDLPPVRISFIRLQVKEAEIGAEWADYKVYDEFSGDEMPEGEFTVPVPENLASGEEYRIRVVATAYDGKDYTFQTNPHRYPFRCYFLTINQAYENAACNEVSTGIATISVDKMEGINLPENGTHNITYYLNNQGTEEEHGNYDFVGGSPPDTEIDTTRLAEGTYPVKAVLTYGTEANPYRASAQGALVVDRTLPSAGISTPVKQSEVCARRTEVSGDEVFYVNIDCLTEDDTQVQSWKIYYGEGENPEVWAPAVSTVEFDNGIPMAVEFELLESEGKFDKAKYGEWNVTNLEYGTYSLMLKVFDVSGNSQCYTTSFDLNPLYTDLFVHTPYFSPNNDGVLDTAGFSYSLSNEATVDMILYQAEQPVRTLLSGFLHPRGNYPLEWDGTGDGGMDLPDGDYELVFVATDSCGNVFTRKVSVHLDTTPPETEIVSPASGSRISAGFVEVIGTAYDVNFKKYDLVGIENQAGVIDPIQNNIDITRQTSLLGAWSAADLHDNWRIHLKAEDKAGNTSEKFVPIEFLVRPDLIKNIALDSSLFSPNADGRLDVLNITYELGVLCEIRVEVYGENNALVKTATLPTVPAGLNGWAWDGGNESGQVVQDGNYRIQVHATHYEDPLITQEESITVRVDNTPPVIGMTAPDAPCLKGEFVARGTITDDHIKKYTLTYAGDSGQYVLDEATQARENYTFGAVSDLAEGEYSLRVFAEDEAENRAEQNIPFIIDRTPPGVSLVQPVDGNLFGAHKNTVSINGTLEEENLTAWELRYAAEGAPNTWHPLASGNEPPPRKTLYQWPVGKEDGIPDGEYIVSLRATDCAGWTTETRYPVIIDNTPPVAAVAAPENGSYLKNTGEITGTAFDNNLREYRVELAAGGCGASPQWTLIKSAAASVPDGKLGTIRVMPPDGDYCLRVKAEDKLGQSAEATATITIDTTPPGPPALSGTLQDKINAALQWTENTEPDLEGYNLYRNGRKINQEILSETSYPDPNLPEDTYTYVVKAVDRAGWESTGSNPVELRADTTGPNVRITAPEEGEAVHGETDISGTASSPDDFKAYRLYVGQGIEPGAWQLVRASPVPIPFGMLGKWDTLASGQGPYSLKLEAEDLTGNVSRHQITVTVDNTPPASPVLLSAEPDAATVAVEWQANTEPDLAGYLLYRNGQLVNAPEAMISDISPYLISGTAYSDTSLPDGEFTYTVEAVDTAGNISGASNSLTVTIDNHAPRALIVTPEDGAEFEKPVTVQAETEDLDIETVQFQYRPAMAGTWNDLGPAATTVPMAAKLDPGALGMAYGEYALRAVATDKGGQTDAAPPEISVAYVDLTPPAEPENLRATANGGRVELTWDPVTDNDLDGYNVYRVHDGSRTLLNTQILGVTTFVHTGGEEGDIADGTYTYEVTAVDTHENESEASERDDALVFTPELNQPYTPSGAAEVEISGVGAEAGATVELFVDAGGGPETQGTTTADETGGYTKPVSLSPGENRVTARAVDTHLNISKYSPRVVVVYNEPPETPTGLAAEVNGTDVALTWNSNVEPDLAGYNLYRDGLKVNQDSAVTSGSAGASIMEHMAGNAVDNDPQTAWTGYFYTATTDQWWQVTLPEKTYINGIRIEWSGGEETAEYAAKDYEIQVWSGYAWITHTRVYANEEKINSFKIVPSYATDRLRLFITAPSDNGSPKQVRLAEVGLTRDNLITGNTCEDLAVPDGLYPYQVSAVDLHGFESPVSDALDVPVGDIEPPAAPAGLTAAATGSEIHLAWTESQDPEVVGYHIYRQDGLGWLKLTGTARVDAAYIDTSLQNGAYVYRVTAVDGAGNESAPSNEASATVSIAEPPQPAIDQISVIAEGEALRVCWDEMGPGVAGYNLYRSETPGGGHEKVNEDLIPDTCYLDEGLRNGTACYYYVTAVDGVGNESIASLEKMAVPLDTVPPGPPVISHPTISGVPWNAVTDRTDIAGMGEPGAVITLYKNNEAVGSLTAEPVETRTCFETQPYLDQPALSPDGRVLAYIHSGEHGNAVWLQRLEQGGTPTRIIPKAYTPAWAPDGGRIAVSYEDGDDHRRVGVYDVETGDLTPVTEEYLADEYSPSWSGDGNRIAFLRSEGWRKGIIYKELATGLFSHVLSDTRINEAGLSPDGLKLWYLRDWELYVADVEEKTATLAADQAAEPVWSPDSARIAFVSAQKNLVVLELDTLSVSLIDTAESRIAMPAWSPDGTTLTYYAKSGGEGTPVQEEIRTKPLHGQTQARTRVENANGATGLQWSPTGDIFYVLGNTSCKITPAGRFFFPGEPLSPGENRYAATAADAGGNVSQPSGEITITLDPNLIADLEILPEDMVVYPAAPVTGDELQISVVYRNRGEVEVNEVGVALHLYAPDGTVKVLAEDTLPTLASGEEGVLNAAWETRGNTGTYQVAARISTRSGIREIDADNNDAQRRVHVAAEQGVDMAATLNALQYGAHEAVPVTVEIYNSGPETTGQLDVTVTDPDGNTVAHLATSQILLEYGGMTQCEYLWNTGETYPGDYAVKAVFAGTGDTVECNKAFAIEPDAGLRAVLTTDKIRYSANENVSVTVDLTNTGQNCNLFDIQTEVRITDDAGNEVFAGELPPAWLLVGETMRLETEWQTGQQPSGTYQATLTVRTGQAPIVKTRTFTIDPDVTITGIVTATPPVVAKGGALQASYEIENIGNTPLTDLGLKLAIVDPDTQMIIETATRVIDLGLNETHTGEVAFSTRNHLLKTYRLALQHNYSGEMKSIATSTFAVRDILGPVVTILSPEAGSVHTGQYALSVTAADDASGISRVEHRVDGGTWMAMPLIDATTGRHTVSRVPLETENGPHTAEFRAYDRAGNVSETETAGYNILVVTPFDELTGTLSIEPDPVYRGHEAEIVYSLTNETQMEVADVAVQGIIRNPAGGAAIFTFNETKTIGPGSSAGNRIPFATAGMPPGTYAAELQVASAEGSGPRKVAEGEFEVLPSLAVEPVSAVPANLLVWVNTGCGNGNSGCCGDDDDDEDDDEEDDDDERESGNSHEQCRDCIRIELLTQILDEAVAEYRIVNNQGEFEEQMRNPLFTDILILGEYHPLTSHYMDELREMVYAGTGLISSQWNHSSINTEVFGIKHMGLIPDATPTIIFDESEISEEVVITGAGEPVRVETLDGARVVAWVVEGQASNGKKDSDRYPGLILHTYGQAKTIYTSFDLGMSLDDENYAVISAVIKNAVEHVHKSAPAAAYRPMQLVPKVYDLTSYGANADAKVTETFPPELKLYDPAMGQHIGESPWEIDVHVEDGEIHGLIYYYLMPNTAGTYLTETEIGIEFGGAYIPIETITTEFTLAADRNMLIDDLVNRLNLLEVYSFSDQHWVWKSIRELEKARRYDNLTSRETSRSIRAVLKAISWARLVRTVDMSEIRLEMDGLLRVEQGTYFHLENSN